YFARIKGIVTAVDCELFKKGLVLQDEVQCLPAHLDLLNHDDKSELSEVFVTIEEGKYHQIKRMFQALGKKVVYLKRLEMGSLTLDPNLPEGKYRPLTTLELDQLTNHGSNVD